MNVRILVTALAVLALTACGGTAASSATPKPPPSPSSQPTPTPNPLADVAGTWVGGGGFMQINSNGTGTTWFAWSNCNSDAGHHFNPNGPDTDVPTEGCRGNAQLQVAPRSPINGQEGFLLTLVHPVMTDLSGTGPPPAALSICLPNSGAAASAYYKPKPSNLGAGAAGDTRLFFQEETYTSCYGPPHEWLKCPLSDPSMTHDPLSTKSPANSILPDCNGDPLKVGQADGGVGLVR